MGDVIQALANEVIRVRINGHLKHEVTLFTNLAYGIPLCFPPLIREEANITVCHQKVTVFIKISGNFYL